MDSRQLYKAAEHLSPLLRWDTDWIHIGTPPDIKINLIDELVDDFLAGTQFYLVLERENSGRHSKDEIIKVIEPLLGQDNFQIWNMALDKAIDFNKMGVLRLGRK